jgi:hypothetical protein
VGATRVSIEGTRADNQNRNVDVSCDPAGMTPQPCADQRRTDAGVVWDIILSGDVERYNFHYALGLYNAMDWKYDAVPSTEYLQRTIRQPGRSVLASAGVRF